VAIQATDIQSLINIQGTPPSKEQIAHLRRKHKGDFLDTAAGKVAMFAPPVMGLDIVASLATAAVEACLPDPVGDLLQDDVASTAHDWGTGVTGRYVDRVRSVGRYLVAAEVKTLSTHHMVESHISTAVDAFKNAIFK
jgi:hypothetical protein